MITPIRVLTVGGMFARFCVVRDMKNRFLVNFVVRLFLVSMVFLRPLVPDSHSFGARLA